MSLSCALWATSLQQWARRYLHRVQPARCSPEKRARMRAFFAEGVDKMHIPWAVEGLPMLLHLSLFLFFGGLAIFLFDVDREVFSCVFSWIGLFFLVYGLITLLPIIRHDSPYHSPLSTPAWFLYAGIHYLAFKILTFITVTSCWSHRTYTRCEDLRDRYHTWMLGGVEKAAEETASERSSEIDVQILNWTISTLGDDDSLKSFFETIPGFFNSKLVKRLEGRFPWELLENFSGALGGFLGRTWSSNSVNDSEKVRRLDIVINTINQIHATDDRLSLRGVLWKVRADEVPHTAEMGHTIARWFTNNDQDIPEVAQCIIAGILVGARERNDGWVTLAARVFGLPERDLQDNIALGGDSVLLAILNHVIRQSLRPHNYDWTVLRALSKFDILDAHPRLQHDFCTLWNKIVQKARNRALHITAVRILRAIRHLYINLHQSTDAAPAAFSDSTDSFDPVLLSLSSYPFCNIASHHPDTTTHVSVPLPTPALNSPDALTPAPTDGNNNTSRQSEQLDNVIQLPSSSYTTTTNEIGATSHGLDITPSINPIHPSSRSTGALPTVVVVTVPEDITSTAMLSHPQEVNEQQDSDIVAPSAAPQILSTASTHGPEPTPAPIPTSLPNTPLESYDAGVASMSHPRHFAPLSISSSMPSSGSATLPPKECESKGD